MKVYLPRWARTHAAHALFGAAVSRQLKLNVPQQRQVVSLCRKLTAPDRWVDLGRQDRKFLAKRLVPYFVEVDRQARSAFRPFWRIFLHPRRFVLYLIRVRGMRALFATLGLGAGGDES